MGATIRVVTVFLASPGDLQAERRLVKETEEELNSCYAKYLGFRVEVKGWEDTLAGARRPQEIINQELDLSDLFVGMMYRKWGTPPSTGGGYTSGFEEEFQRTLIRLEATGKPDMAMYFKEIEEQFLSDPGTGLKKVLAFKKRLIDEKRIFFEIFSDPYELQRRVRQKVVQHLIDLKSADEEGAEEQLGRSRHPTNDSQKSEAQQVDQSPFSSEGHVFIEELLKKVATKDGIDKISSFEIARFRLLSSAVTKSGNDEPTLGVHDANIVFSNRGTQYGNREVTRLLDCGLRNFKHENVPIWHWYCKFIETYDVPTFVFRTLNKDSSAQGAFDVLRLVDPADAFEDGPFDREFFVSGWMTEDREDTTKVAALYYLTHFGREEDIRYIQDEFDRTNSKTSRAALEAIVGIQARHSYQLALKTALSNQFDSFDESLLDDLLQHLSELEEELLRKGFVHRNDNVRLSAFRTAISRDCISDGDIANFSKDTSARVRLEAVKYMVTRGDVLKDDDAKKILVRPKARTGFGLLRASGHDEEGQRCFDEFEFERFCKMRGIDLVELDQASPSIDAVPYLALCTRYFARNATELRHDVDNRFADRFQHYLDYLRQLGVTEENIEKSKALEDFVRRGNTRKGLDILCRKKDAADTKRVREGLSSDYIDSSEAEIEFLAKHGEWADIPLILAAKKDGVAASNSLAIFSGNTGWQRSLAEAAYNIGKNRLDDLLVLEMPDGVLAELIELAADSKIRTLKRLTLMTLLNNSNERVRKVTALKCILALSKADILNLMSDYETGQEYRYYNVLVWLDCGVSMPRVTTKRIARAELNVAK